MGDRKDNMVEPKRLKRPNFQEILADLNSIAINQQDVLFDLEIQLDADDESKFNYRETYVQLQKLVVFKVNLKSINSMISTSIPVASNSKISFLTPQNLKNTFLKHFHNFIFMKKYQ